MSGSSIEFTKRDTRNLDYSLYGVPGISLEGLPRPYVNCRLYRVRGGCRILGLRFTGSGSEEGECFRDFAGNVDNPNPTKKRNSKS